jgi:hypothetical protein
LDAASGPAFAQAAAARGATPLVEMDPARITLERIANATYDPYLVAYARAVAKLCQRVISFGPRDERPPVFPGLHHSGPASFTAA